MDGEKCLGAEKAELPERRTEEAANDDLTGRPERIELNDADWRRIEELAAMDRGGI